MAQRDILAKDIVYVLLYGDWRLRGKRYQVTLSREFIPNADRAEFGHLAGLVVIIDYRGKWVITTYRERGKETYARQPYVRGGSDWRRLVNDALMN